VVQHAGYARTIAGPPSGAHRQDGRPMRRLDPECYCTEINYPRGSSQRIIVSPDYRNHAGEDESQPADDAEISALGAIYIIRCGERRKGVALPHSVRKRTK
jgi:hypothetical protein